MKPMDYYRAPIPTNPDLIPRSEAAAIRAKGDV
jgi:hypothetical protein